LKTVKLSPSDELVEIEISAMANARALKELQESRRFDEVEKLFRGTKNLLTSMDQKMKAICLEYEDQAALTSWAVRTGIIGKNLDNIERNLPHKGTRLFDWDLVISSLGLLVAFRMGVEQTIAVNPLKLEEVKVGQA